MKHPFTRPKPDFRNWCFLDHTMPTCGQIDYRLVGTGAALLHGVSLPAADIDILVRERQNVDAFGTALAAFRCLEAPAWLAQTQQYYGNYEVNGVEVGISTVEVASEADTIETFGRGPGTFHAPHLWPLYCANGNARTASHH